MNKLPVMYSIYGNQDGPWYLGYVNPKYKDLLKTKTDFRPTEDSLPNVPVFGQFDVVPMYPQLIVPFEDFTAPNWKSTSRK